MTWSIVPDLILRSVWLIPFGWGMWRIGYLRGKSAGWEQRQSEVRETIARFEHHAPRPESTPTPNPRSPHR